MVVRQKSDIGTFQKQQRAKIKARELKRRAKGLTARAKKRGSGKRVEVIGGRLVEIGLEQPDLFTKEGKKAVAKEEVINGKKVLVTRGFTRLDLVRGKAIEKGIEREATRQLARKFLTPDFETIRNLPKKKAEPIFIPTRVITPIKLLTKAKLEVVKPKKKIIKGRIEPVTRKKGFFEISKEKQISRIQEIRRKPKTTVLEELEVQFRGSVALGALGAARGVKGVFGALTNPKKFVKEQVAFGKEFVKNPRGITRELTREFQNDPAGIIAEFATFSKTAGLVGKGVKKSPLGRAVAEEVFIARQPKEVRPAVRAIIKTAKVQEKINPSNVKKIKNVDFAEVKELKPGERIALEKTLKETNSFIFGSLASRTLSQKKTKIPKDVDLATSNVDTFNTVFMKNLPKNLRKDLIVKAQKIVRKGTGDTVLDVKPVNRLVPDKSLITRKGTLPITGLKDKVVFFKDSQLIIPKVQKGLVTEAFTPTQRLEKVGGIKLVGFGEQTTRKGLGTLQVLLEKNPRRAKDPAAFVESIELQLNNIKKSTPKTPIGKLQKKNRMKKLEEGLKILKSKQFSNLLEKKVPGLTKEYPILSKIDAKKLKNVQRAKGKRTKFVEPELKEFKFKEIGKGKNPFVEKPSKIPSKLPSKLPSKIPKPSVLPQIRISEIPSKIPSKIKKPSSTLKKPSKVPSKPSKLPSKIPKPSVLPSKVPKPSKFPSKLPSKVPSKPSKLPSKIPSKLPSKLPKPIPKPIKLKKQKLKLLKKKEKIGKTLQLTEFTTTVTRPGTGKKGKGLLFGDIELFTGAELR